jgi:parallel beta-helix repeat protein
MQTRKNRAQGRRSIEKLARAIARGPAGLERLEDRRLLTATFTVFEMQDFRNPDDSTAPAEGTLRWAIDKANHTPGRDTIDFNFTGPDQVTLSLDADMDAEFGPLTVTEGVDIVGVRNGDSPLVWLDGGTGIDQGLIREDGASTVSGLGFSNFETAVHVISAGNTIGGDAADDGNFFISNYEFGVRIDSTANNTSVVNNLMAVNLGPNVLVDGLGPDNGNGPEKQVVTGVVISNNLFGLGADGVRQPGNFGHAIQILNTAADSDVRIAGNTIGAGSADGIRITAAAGVTITGNQIGVDINGDEAENTANAIAIEAGSSDIMVGGARGGDGNLLANNQGNGLRVTDSSGVTVIGNTVRANLDDGIALVNASDNKVLANTIVDGGSNGVAVYTDPVDNPAVDPVAKGNTIRGNSIFNNNGLGIELMTQVQSGSIPLPSPGPTPAGNADYAYTAAPTLAYAKTYGLTVVVTGTLQGVAGQTYLIDVYANSLPDVDPTYGGRSYGEGEFFLGTVSATADALGNVTFAAAFEGLDPANFTAVSATATASDGGTSEFSEDAVTAAAPAPFATTPVLTSSAPQTRPGKDVTFTARVSGPDGAVVHSGLVEFFDGDTSLGVALVDNGAATITVSTLALGNHLITATYSPASTDFTGSSASLSHEVAKVPTTTTLAAPPASDAGQSVTFTATVAFSDSALPATGAVQFWEGGTLLGTVNLTGNQASLTLSNLTGGAHTVTAVYVGSATHLASTSAPVTHTVNVSNPDVPFLAAGHTLRDTTGNGLSSDDTALPGVNVKIIKDNNGNGILDAGDTLFTTVTTNSSGYFELTLAPGNYLAQEVTPSGYLQTGPNNPSYYAFTASVNDSKTSLDFSSWKQCDCCDDVINIAYIINGTTRVNDLRGNTNAGDVVQAVFTVPAGHSPITVSLVSYTAPSGVWDANLASLQKIWEQQTGTFGPGTYTLTVNLPETFYQVDFICGPAIDQLGPIGSNIFYSAQNRLFSADNDGSIAYVDGTSSISGYVYNDLDNDGARDADEPGIPGVKVLLSAADGSSKTVFTDSRGRYAFANLQPGDYAITETQPAGYLSGKETPGNTFSSVKITAARGSRTGYNFGELAMARLSGFVYADKNNDGVKQSSEKGLAGVTLTLMSGATTVATTTTDSTGAYTFAGVAAGNYTIVESQPAGYVDGIESAGNLGGYDDGDNNTISSINVTSGAVGADYNFGELSESFLCTGETATIGFWQNKNGQNLIKSFNGSSSSKKLAGWLAQTFPNLYGAGSPNCLLGKNNNDVAALFKSLFKVSGQKLDAQVLGVALAVYSTTNSLGGTAAARYGFTVDAIGTGNRLYNIGGNGQAFGVANNINMTVLDILDAANDRAVNGVLYNGNATLRNMANTVFTGINERGDI